MVTDERLQEYMELRKEWFNLAMQLAVEKSPLEKFKLEAQLQKVHGLLSEEFSELKSMGIDPI